VFLVVPRNRKENQNEESRKKEIERAYCFACMAFILIGFVSGCIKRYKRIPEDRKKKELQ
jgi:hypothetical protein